MVKELCEEVRYSHLEMSIMQYKEAVVIDKLLQTQETELANAYSLDEIKSEQEVFRHKDSPEAQVRLNTYKPKQGEH